MHFPLKQNIPQQGVISTLGVERYRRGPKGGGGNIPPLWSPFWNILDIHDYLPPSGLGVDRYRAAFAFFSFFGLLAEHETFLPINLSSAACRLSLPVAAHMNPARNRRAPPSPPLPISKKWRNGIFGFQGGSPARLLGVQFIKGS